MAGRATKFTPDRIRKILEGLRSGMTRRASAAYGGVSEDTLQTWLRQPSKSNFTAQVAEAENIAESRYTAVIAKAAFGQEVTIRTTTTKPNGDTVTKIETKREYDWKAGLEWLKRRRRKDWGDKFDIGVDEEIEKTLEALKRITAEEEQSMTDDTQETLH